MSQFAAAAAAIWMSAVARITVCKMLTVAGQWSLSSYMLH